MSQSSKAPTVLYTLDQLQNMSMSELEQAYRDAPCPSSLAVTVGEPKGSVLAIKALDKGPRQMLVNKITQIGVFPWMGKNFSAKNGEAGAGNNRINLLGLTRQNWYNFDTRFANSCIDGKRCVLLDYDKSENPFFIRAIVDELREAAPGLLFGPAQIRVGKRKPYPVLYFSVSYQA